MTLFLTIFASFLHFTVILYFFFYFSSAFFAINCSFLPRITVSMQFACTVYWWTAECTQPSVRFMNRALVRAHVCAGFREYQEVVGVEQVSLQTPPSVFRVWHSACFSRILFAKFFFRTSALIAFRGVDIYMLKIANFWYILKFYSAQFS